MRTDDELLVHVRTEACRRLRRRRVVLSGVAMAVVAAFGALALARAGGDGGRVVTVDVPSTTITEVSSTTNEASPSTTIDVGSTTATGAPAASTTSTTVAPSTTTSASTTTTLVPIGPVTSVARGDGIVVMATARQDPARPGVVSLDVRVQAAHGSDPGGRVVWRAGEVEERFGAPASIDCGVYDPTSTLPPDPAAGSLDVTFHLEHDYGTRGLVLLDFQAGVSDCTSDAAYAGDRVQLQVGG